MVSPFDFFDRVGLTIPVRRWLADNDGDDLRDRIVTLIIAAADEQCPETYIDPLRRLIAKIPFFMESENK